MYTLSETERIALVAENTYNPVVIADLERKIVWVNNAFTELTGYTLEEAQGKSPSFLHCENTDKEEVKSIGEKLARKEKVCADLINKNKFGREYWIRFCITPVYVGDRFIGYISIENEITKEKTLLKELQESELKYKAIFNSSNDRHVFIDKNYTLRAFNKSAKKHFKANFNVDIAEGGDFRDYLMSPEVAKMFYFAFDQAINGKDFFFDEEVVLANGKKQWYSFRGAPVRNDNDEIIGGTFNWRENTKEKHLAVLLEENELKYKAIIDSTEDRHVLIDLNNKILAFNKSALKNLAATFGFEMKEGDDFVDYFKGHEHVFMLNEGIAKAFDNEIYTYESCVNSPTGDKWLRISYLPVNNTEGSPVGISINWSDITAQKEAEQKAQNQLKQLREFSHITSHKLRQPLANIIGLTDLITGGANNEEIASLIYKLKTVASDLDDVINTMSLTVATADFEGADKQKTPGVKAKIESVFIVDDDPVNNLIASKLLKKTLGNVRVDEFLLAPKAIEKLKDGALPDLILLDINMHPMDGWDFLNEFEKLNLPVPVVMCSSSVDPEDFSRAKNHPLVNSFLSKPLLAEHIKELTTL